MSDATIDGRSQPHAGASCAALDPAVAMAFGCIIVLLLFGSLYSTKLPVAGVSAAAVQGGVVPRRDRHRHDARHPARPDRPVGALGGGGRRHDGSAAAAWDRSGGRLRFRSVSLCGVAIGLVNGIGVAYLRIPSMIITLAVNAVAQGLMVVHTGGFSPQDSASAAMRFLATGFTVPGIPNAVLVWAVDRRGRPSSC